MTTTIGTNATTQGSKIAAAVAESTTEPRKRRRKRAAGDPPRKRGRPKTTSVASEIDGDMMNNAVREHKRLQSKFAAPFKTVVDMTSGLLRAVKSAWAGKSDSDDDYDADPDVQDTRPLKRPRLEQSND